MIVVIPDFTEAATAGAGLTREGANWVERIEIMEDLVETLGF
jgi:hypothetical protein